MKTVRKRSQKQEKSVAKEFNARVTLASGALWFSKSDVRSEKFLIECKTTQKGFYTITNKVWEKVDNEALKDGMRTPLLIVDLHDTERYVVFNPTNFNQKVSGYEVSVSVQGGCNSFKFKGYTEENLPILFSVLSLKSNKKNHILMAMKIEEFEDVFKDEL